MQVNTIRKSVIILLVIGAIVLVLNWKFDLTGKKGVQEQIAKIHATKLTLADVMGDNLPPDPGAAADATIAGIDANKNGIRDDVELAVFKAYPNSAKIRMPLLQYALSMQQQMTLNVVTKDTVTATVEDTESRASVCLWTLSSRDNLEKFIKETDYYEKFVKDLQLNNPSRINYLHNIIEGNLGSFGLSNDGCDIEPSTLPK
jgi:hypothetical protein